MIRRLLRNRNVWLIVLFVALFISAALKCSAAESELHLEAGSAIVRGETPAVLFRLRWPEAGPGDSDYECLLGLIGSTKEADNQSTLACLLVEHWKQFDVGLGVGLLHHTDVYNGSRENFALMLGWRIKERLSLNARHWSNAGQTDVNKGRDIILLGFRLQF